MEQLFLNSLVDFVTGLTNNNPVYFDILKMAIGCTAWIGGMAGFVYYREKKLRAAVVSK